MVGCSVTKVTASAIEKKYVDGMRTAGKPSDAEQKREIAEKAMAGACAGFNNYAITGEKGKRNYADFNKVRTCCPAYWPAASPKALPLVMPNSPHAGTWLWQVLEKVRRLRPRRCCVRLSGEVHFRRVDP